MLWSFCWILYTHRAPQLTALWEWRKLKHSVFSLHSTFLRFLRDVRCEWRNHLMYFGGFHVKQKLEALSLEIFIFIVESTFISFLVAISTHLHHTACNHKWNSQHSIKKLCVVWLKWSFMMFIFPQIPYRIVSCAYFRFSHSILSRKVLNEKLIFPFSNFSCNWRKSCWQVF